MAIRRAKNEDITRIMELLGQVCMVHHQGRPDLFKIGSKYTEDELVELLADDTRPVLVWTGDDGRIGGYVFCVIQEHIGSTLLTDIKTLYIDDLCVDESMRGRHIGTELYNAALRLASELGCYNLTLNVWSLNKGALEFYKSLGMIPQKIGMEVILG